MILGQLFCKMLLDRTVRIRYHRGYYVYILNSLDCCFLIHHSHS